MTFEDVFAGALQVLRDRCPAAFIDNGYDIRVEDIEHPGVMALTHNTGDIKEIIIEPRDRYDDARVLAVVLAHELAHATDYEQINRAAFEAAGLTLMYGEAGDGRAWFSGVLTDTEQPAETFGRLASRGVMGDAVYADQVGVSADPASRDVLTDYSPAQAAGAAGLAGCPQ